MNVLIAGGTGLIGTRLIEMLEAEGHQTAILTRSQSNAPMKMKCFEWEPEHHVLPQEAIEWAEGIVNLAGASVGEHRWTEKWKREILESRITSTNAIVERLRSLHHNVKVLVNASGINYYGYERVEPVDEDSTAGKGFLAKVCQKWEAAAMRAEEKVKVVITRNGTVLSHAGGAYESFAKTIKRFAGAPLGNGRQLMPWIHIDDVCRFTVRSLTEAGFSGAYNLVSPSPVTNQDLTEMIAERLNKPLILPRVPPFALEIAIGEFSDALLGSLPAYSRRLKELSFEYKYPTIEAALDEIAGHAS